MNGGDGGIVGSTVHIISGGLDPQGVIDRLRAAMTIADERLQQAAIKAGVLYMGCDTPDALADTICELRAEVERLTSDLSGVTDECANLLKIKARLEAECERLRAERDARLSQFEQLIRHHFSTYGQTTLAKAIQELRSWGDAARKAGEERG